MKHSKKLFCFALMFCLGVELISYAQPEDNNDEKGSYFIINEKGGNYRNNRPNSPDAQFITCSYHNGVLTLNFAEPEGVCRGSISDLTYGTYQFITFDSDELNVDITAGPLTDFTIEFTTAHGNTYTGSTQK